MKQIYSLVTFSLIACFATAQDKSISACNHPEGGIQISFDYSEACPNAPGDLSGMDEIGFHSGVNGWATSVAWDAADALTAANDGDDIFTLYIADPETYYGEASITEYNFVFNQGAEVPADPWASEGKADDGMGGCTDLTLSVANITETCALPLPVGIEVCKTEDGGIHISFDLEENCASANGDLSGMDEIGFHSGINGWATAVAWDATDAVSGENDGEDVFDVFIEDPATYYGASDISEYNFVFNQGIEVPASPWDSEAKADDGNGGCADFKFYTTDVMETCPEEEELVVFACNDPNGGIQILFDYAENCEAAPGDMSAMKAIGFHSGVNSWATSVAWDATDAVQANHVEDGIFAAYLMDPATYYGENSITEYNFVFNQGAENPSDAWAAEGKMDDGMGGCADFTILATDITETCEFMVSTFEPTLSSQISVYPNPFSAKATLALPGNGEVFSISVQSITGETISRVSGVSEANYPLPAGQLKEGVYFVTVQSASGKMAVKKIIVQ